MASNGIMKYVKNVAHSVSYAAADVFQEKMPMTSKVIASNKDTVKDIYKSFVDMKTTLPKLSNIRDNTIFRTLNKGFENLKTDLKSGEFYHPEREDPMAALGALSALSSVLGEGSEDFKELMELLSGIGNEEEMQDENGNIDYNTHPEQLATKGDALVATVIAKTSSYNSNCIAKAMTNLTDAKIKSDKLIAQIQMNQMQQSLQLQHIGFQNMTNGLQSLIDFNSKVMQVHVQNSRQYYETSTGLFQDISNSLKTIQQIQTTVYQDRIDPQEDATKDVNKINFAEVFKDGVFNLAAYKKAVSAKIEKSPIGQMLLLVKTIPIMMQNLVNNPLHEIAKMGVNAFTGPALNVALSRLDRTLGSAFQTGLAKLYDYGQENSKTMFGKIAKMFGIKQERKGFSNVDLSKYNKGAMSWNGIAQKALVEVIPGYLRNIESGITGQEARLFDFQNGKWTTIRAIQREKDNYNKNNAKVAVSGLTDEIRKRAMNTGLLEDETNRREFNKALEELAQGIYADGRFKRQNITANKNFKYGKNNNILQSMIYPIITEIEKVEPGIISDLTRAINATVAQSNDYLSSLGGDDNPSLLKELLTGGLNGAPTTRPGTSLGKPMAPVTDLTRLEDDRGYTVYDYLYMILNELHTKPSFGGPGGGNNGEGNPPNPPITSDITDLMEALSGKESKETRKKHTPEPTIEIEGTKIPSAMGYKKKLETLEDLLSEALTDGDQNKAYAIANIIDEIQTKKMRRSAAAREKYDRMTGAAYLPIENTVSEDTYNIIRNADITRLNNQSDQTDETNALREQYKQAMAELMAAQQEINEKEYETEFRHADSFLSDLFHDRNQQRTLKIDRSAYTPLPEGITEDMGITDQLLKAADMGQKFDVIRHNIEALQDAPSIVFANVVSSADKAVYDLLFGRETGEKDEDGNPINGIFGKMSKLMDDTFGNLNEGMNGFLDDWKNRLGGTNGIIGWLKRNIKDFAGVDIDAELDNIKSGIRNTVSPYLSQTGKAMMGGFQDTGRQVHQYVIDTLADLGIKPGERIRLPDLISDQQQGNPDEEPQTNAFGGRFARDRNVGLSIVSPGEAIKPPKGYEEYGTDRVQKTELRAIPFGSEILNANENPKSGMGFVNLAEQLKNEQRFKQNLIDSIETNAMGKKSNTIIERVLRMAMKYGITAQEINEFFDADPEVMAQVKEKIEYNHNYDPSVVKIMDQLYNLANKNDDDIQSAIMQFKVGTTTSQDGKLTLGKEVRTSNVDKILDFENLKNKSYTRLRDTREVMQQYGQGDKMMSDEAIARAKFAAKEGPITGVRQMMTTMTGTDPKKAAELTLDYTKRNMKGLAKSGAAGALMSAVLPLGGPIMGAAVGMAANMISKSNIFQDIMFGSEITKADGTKTREGGLITPEIQKTYEKYMPDIKKYGTTGAIAGLVLPFGPLGGAMLGAGASILKNNKQLNNFLFGAEGGLLNDKRKEKIKKAFPHMGAGMLATLLLNPFGFGLLGNAALGAGIGLMSTTESFKRILLGAKGSDGIRRGGLAGIFRAQITDPLKSTMKEIRDELGGWLRDKIISPIGNGLKPIGQVATSVIEKSVDTLTNKVGGYLFGENGLFRGTAIGRFANNMLSGVRQAGGFGKWATQKLAGGLAERVASGVEGIGQFIGRKGVQYGFDTTMSAEDRAKYYEEGTLKDKAAYDFDKFMTTASSKQLSDISSMLGMANYTTGGKWGAEAFNKKQKDMLDKMRSDMIALGENSEDDGFRRRLQDLAIDLDNMDKMKELGFADKEKVDKFFDEFYAKNKAFMSKEQVEELKQKYIGTAKELKEMEAKRQVSTSDTYFDTESPKTWNAVADIMFEGEPDKEEKKKAFLSDIQARDIKERRNILEKFYRTSSDEVHRAKAREDEEAEKDKEFVIREQLKQMGIEDPDKATAEQRAQAEQTINAIKAKREQAEKHTEEVTSETKEGISKGQEMILNSFKDAQTQSEKFFENIMSKNQQMIDTETSIFKTSVEEPVQELNTTLKGFMNMLNGVLTGNLEKIKSGVTDVMINGPKEHIQNEIHDLAINHAAKKDDDAGFGDHKNVAKIYENSDDSIMSEASKKYQELANQKEEAINRFNGKTTHYDEFIAVKNSEKPSYLINASPSLLYAIYKECPEDKKDDFVTLLKELYTEYKTEAIKSFLERIKSTITKAKDTASNLVGKLADKVSDAASSAINKGIELTTIPEPALAGIPTNAGGTGFFKAAWEGAKTFGKGAWEAGKESFLGDDKSEKKESTTEDTEEQETTPKVSGFGSFLNTAIQAASNAMNMGAGAQGSGATEGAQDDSVIKEVTTADGDVMTYGRSSTDGSLMLIKDKNNMEIKQKIAHKNELQERSTSALERIAEKLGAGVGSIAKGAKQTGSGLWDLLKTAAGGLGNMLSGGLSALFPAIGAAGGLVPFLKGKIMKAGGQLLGFLKKSRIGKMMLAIFGLGAAAKGIKSAGGWLYDKIFLSEEEQQQKAREEYDNYKPGMVEFDEEGNPIEPEQEKGDTSALASVGGYYAGRKLFGKHKLLGGAGGSAAANALYSLATTGELPDATDIATDVGTNYLFDKAYDKFFGKPGEEVPGPDAYDRFKGQGFTDPEEAAKGKGLFTRAKEYAGKKYDDAAEYIGKKYGAAKDYMKGLNLGEKAVKAKDYLKGVGTDVFEGVTKYGKQASEFMGENIVKGMDYAQDAAPKLMEQGAELITKVKGHLKDFYQAIAKFIPGKAMKEGVKNFFNGIMKRVFSSPQIVAKAMAKLGRQAMTAVGGAATFGIGAVVIGAAFAAKDFYDGYNDADELWKVPEGKSTTGMKIAAGVVNALFGVIPFIGPFLPVDLALELFVEYAGSFFGFGAKELNELRNGENQVEDKTEDTKSVLDTVMNVSMMPIKGAMTAIDMIKGAPDAIKSAAESAQNFFQVDRTNEIKEEIKDMNTNNTLPTNPIEEQAQAETEEKRSQFLEALLGKIKNGMNEIGQILQKYIPSPAILGAFALAIIDEIKNGEKIDIVMKSLQKVFGGLASMPTVGLTFGTLNPALVTSNFTAGAQNAEQILGLKAGMASMQMKTLCGVTTAVVLSFPYLEPIISQQKFLELAMDKLGPALGVEQKDIDKLKKVGKDQDKDAKDVQGKLEGMQNLDQSTWGGQFRQMSKGIFTGVVQSATETAKAMGQKMSEVASKAASGAKNWVKDKVQTVKDIMSKAGETASKVKDAAVGAYEKAKSKVGEWYNDAKSFVSSRYFGSGRHGQGYNDIDYENDSLTVIRAKEAALRKQGVDVPTFHSQLDPKNNIQYNSRQDTVYQTGRDSLCGPVAVSNALESLGVHDDPKAGAAFAIQNGYKEKNGGTKPGFTMSYPHKFGVQTEELHNKESIENKLKNHQPVVLQGKDDRGDNPYNPFGSNPHIVTATGMDSKGNITVQDPESVQPNKVYKSKDVLDKSNIAIGMQKKDKTSYHTKDSGFLAKLRNLRLDNMRRKAGRGLRSLFGMGKNMNPEQIAVEISKNTGLPAELVWAQMYHETGNFEGNPELVGNHNYGGVKQANGDVPFGSPRTKDKYTWTVTGEDNRSHSYFASDEDFVNYMSWYYPQYKEDGLLNAKTPEEWAAALKRGGYYTDDESNYANAIKSIIDDNKEVVDRLKKNSPSTAAPAGGSGGKFGTPQQQGGVQQKAGGFLGAISDLITTLQNALMPWNATPPNGQQPQYNGGSSGGAGATTNIPAGQMSGGSVAAASQWANSIIDKPEHWYGNNGCTAFAKDYLKHSGSPMYDNLDLYVPNWYDEAVKGGYLKGPEQPGAEGDVAIVRDVDGEPQHVVIADGRGGYWGNSSGQGVVVHNDSITGDYNRLFGYLPTGSGQATVATGALTRTDAEQHADAGPTDGMGRHSLFGRERDDLSAKESNLRQMLNKTGLSKTPAFRPTSKDSHSELKEKTFLAMLAKDAQSVEAQPQYGQSRYGMAVSSPETAGEIWNYFKNAGLSNKATAAVMGNLQAESNLYSDISEGGTHTPEINVDGETGYGLAQWTSEGRQQALADFAKSKGQSSSDWKTQLDFMLSGNDDAIPVEEMDAAPTVEDAAEKFHRLWERSADDAEMAARRGVYAKQFLDSEGKGVIDGASSFKGGSTGGQQGGTAGGNSGGMFGWLDKMASGLKSMPGLEALSKIPSMISAAAPPWMKSMMKFLTGSDDVASAFGFGSTQAAPGGATTTGGAPNTPSSSPQTFKIDGEDVGARVVAEAKKLVEAGTRIESATMVKTCFNNAGVPFDYVSAQTQLKEFESRNCFHEGLQGVRPGDVLIFGTDKEKVNHVAIYESGTTMIEAPTNGFVVKEASMDGRNILGFADLRAYCKAINLKESEKASTANFRQMEEQATKETSMSDFKKAEEQAAQAGQGRSRFGRGTSTIMDDIMNTKEMEFIKPSEDIGADKSLSAEEKFAADHSRFGMGLDWKKLLKTPIDFEGMVKRSTIPIFKPGDGQITDFPSLRMPPIFGEQQPEETNNEPTTDLPNPESLDPNKLENIEVKNFEYPSYNRIDEDDLITAKRSKRAKQIEAYKEFYKQNAPKKKTKQSALDKFFSNINNALPPFLQNLFGIKPEEKKETPIETLPKVSEDGLAKETAPNGEHYEENDIKYLMDNGYSRDEAINLLSKEDKYTKKKEITAAENKPLVQNSKQVQDTVAQAKENIKNITTVKEDEVTKPIEETIQDEQKEKERTTAISEQQTNIGYGNKLDILISEQQKTNALLEAIIELGNKMLGTSIEAKTPKLNPNTQQYETPDTQNIKAALSMLGDGSNVGIGDKFLPGSNRDGSNMASIVQSMNFITRR